METDHEFIVPGREALLRCLNTDIPALAEVKSHLDRGNVQAASRAYAGYFRSKDLSTCLLKDWSTIPRNPNHQNETAARFFEGHLRDGYNVYEIPDSGIDWHGATVACLTRFPIFKALTECAYHSDDPMYVRAIIEHGREYMAAWPIESFTGQHTKTGWDDHYVVAAPWWWCMLPNRLEAWAEALAVIRSSPHVTDEELITILHRMYEETRFLIPFIQQDVDRGHNSGSNMIKVLAIMCNLLGEFKDAAGWKTFDAELFVRFIDSAFYPDGLDRELSIGYSASVVLQMSKICHTLRDQPEVARLRDRFIGIVEALIALRKPNGLMPSFGDFYASHIADYLHQPLIEWLGMDWADAIATEKTTPAPPFRHWPERDQDSYGGYYVMRSDWSRNANYLMIDGGPWGTTHQHGDRLSFVLSACGRDFITDPCCTQYANNELDAFLSEMRAGFLHNGIVVDGVDIHPKESIWTKPTNEALINRWEQHEQYVLFEGTYDFGPIKPVLWKRRIIFVEKSYWLLQDVLTGPPGDTVHVEQNFQFEENIRIALEDNSAVAAAPGDDHLIMKPLDHPLVPSIIIGDKTPHITYWSHWHEGKPMQFEHGRGWVARFTNKPFPAPALVYAGSVQLPVILTTAMIPVRGDPMRLVSIGSETDGADTVWVLPTASGVLKVRTGLHKFELVKST